MEIIIPDNLNEITLKQFLKFKEVDIEKSTDLFVAQKMISIFCNLDIKVVESLPMKDFQEISNLLVDLLNTEPSFTHRFNYKGKDYGFIPNLDTMTFGEYIDIDNAFKEEDLNAFLQVVYRPITKTLLGKYEVEPYNVENLIDMTDVPYGVYKGAEVFFYRLGKDLLKAMMNYLQTQAVESSQKSILISGVNGVGIIQLLNSLGEIYSNLTELQNLKSVKRLCICAT